MCENTLLNARLRDDAGTRHLMRAPEPRPIRLDGETARRACRWVALSEFIRVNDDGRLREGMLYPVADSRSELVRTWQLPGARERIRRQRGHSRAPNSASDETDVVAPAAAIPADWRRKVRRLGVKWLSSMRRSDSSALKKHLTARQVLFPSHERSRNRQVPGTGTSPTTCCALAPASR